MDGPYVACVNLLITRPTTIARQVLHTILHSTQELITQSLVNLPGDLVFNPFEQCEDDSALLTDTDIDPDTDYFSVDELNTALH